MSSRRQAAATTQLSLSMNAVRESDGEQLAAPLIFVLELDRISRICFPLIANRALSGGRHSGFDRLGDNYYRANSDRRAYQLSGRLGNKPTSRAAPQIMFDPTRHGERGGRYYSILDCALTLCYIASCGTSPGRAMKIDTRRREFIAALAALAALGGAAAWPFLARAQQAKLRTIGLLGGATASAQAQWTVAFVQRLRELGWVEGQTVAIEYRWVEGRFERSPAVIAEFVRLNVDVIVTHATPNVLAAKQVTSAIPIVFASAGDPVGNELVTSLARPGGNVTGQSVRSADLAQKLVELLRELLPNLRRLAILSHIGNVVTSLQVNAVQAAARSFGLDVAIVEIGGAEDIAPAIEKLKARSDALIVPSEPLYNTNRIQISSLALRAGLPTIYFDRVYVETGGLMSYGPNWPSMWRRTAEFVDKILRGAKPADIPVEQPMTFAFVINLKTAKALGLTVPRISLARADELIE
jgi:putative ABC transport system substrate-binding protein